MATNPVVCSNCKTTPKVYPARRIESKDSPARGVRIGKAEVICPTCGWASAKCDETLEAVREWNRVMGEYVSGRDK